METIRAFIAIELNEQIQKTLGQIQDDLKKSGADVKWVKPKNIHLTLKFLGQTPVDKIESIRKAIESSTVAQEPFFIELTHIGAFPKIERPKIIWLGMQEGTQESTRIAGLLEEKLEPLGFKKEERKFQTHITIGRIRSPHNQFALSKAIKNYSLSQKLSQAVDHIGLIKSTLTPQGPIYEAQHTIKLSS